MQTIDFTPLDIKPPNTALRTLKFVSIGVFGLGVFATIVVLIFGEKALNAIPLWVIGYPVAWHYAGRNQRKTHDSITSRLSAFAEVNGWTLCEVESTELEQVLTETGRGNFSLDKGKHYVINGEFDGQTFMIAWLTGAPGGKHLRFDWPMYRTIVRSGTQRASVSRMALYPAELWPLFAKVGLLG